MADSDSDGVAGLLGDIDELDDQLFAGSKKKVTFTDKKQNKTGGALNDLDSLFGDRKKKDKKKSLDDLISGAVPKSTVVSFLDEPIDLQTNENIKESMPPKRPSSASLSSSIPTTKSNLDDLFFGQKPSPEQPRRVQQVQQTQPSTAIGDLFGPKKKSNIASSPEEKRRTQPPSDGLSFLNPSPPETQQQHVPIVSQSTVGYDRTQRLEKEIERLNREIDDLKKRSREEETELVDEWKQRLAKSREESDARMIQLKQQQKDQLDQLAEEQEINLRRLKINFEQQINAITDIQKQSRGYEEMATRVELVSQNLQKVSADVATVSDRSLEDRERSIQQREMQLDAREHRLENEQQDLTREKEKVQVLLNKLQSNSEQSEQLLLKEKWQVREERNRLNTEKQSFKEDRKAIVEAMERERIDLQKNRNDFLREQHDLLLRVVSERDQLDEQRHAFMLQRDGDVSRLKTEAAGMDAKMAEVRQAEALIRSSALLFDKKHRHLMELEKNLMDECVELERCRTQLRSREMEINNDADMEQPSSTRGTIGTRFKEDAAERPFEESPREIGLIRQGSLRSVMRHHAKLLDRYIAGQ